MGIDQIEQILRKSKGMPIATTDKPSTTVLSDTTYDEFHYDMSDLVSDITNLDNTDILVDIIDHL